MRKKATAKERAIYAKVGRKVAWWRRSRSLSQSQLAKRCGRARGSIANIEAGRQRLPVHTLYRIAAALSVSVGKLLP